MNIDKKIVHVSEASSFLACSSKVIYDLIRDGKIKAYKTGRAWKIPEKSIDDYIVARLNESNSVT